MLYLTDKYGSLRVLVSIKTYIDNWLDDKADKIEVNNNNYQCQDERAENTELRK